MQEITIHGFTFPYVLTHKTRVRITIRVKEGVLYINSPKRTSFQMVENLIERHFQELQKSVLETKKENVIHFNGKAYIPRFLVGNHKGVSILNDEILIMAKENNEDEYSKVLHDFYKRKVIEEVERILPEAKMDFSEIVFPEIKYSYMTSMFGNYYRFKHLIHLSSMLAKYDLKYVKSVLYHELTHVTVFNHSKDFYIRYESKYPNARKIQRELKKIKYHDCI